MKKKLTFNNIITIVLLIAIFLILTLLLTGHRLYYVRTNSMDPDIPQWSLIVDKTYKNKDIFYDKVSVGDDLTYKTESGTVVTHRIVFIDEINDVITTQGINGDAALDKSISFSQVLGVVTFSIPMLGYLVVLLKTWYFWTMLVCLIMIGLIIKFIIKESKNNK